ncbi:MAG: cyclic nucleotide-binding domain-containing protein [Butyrivibrio sp.]|nr:cyclic nucleotide-binding domain-containing protein [Butyrivibrio sp.]
MAKNFDEKSVVNRNKIYTISAGTVILQEGEANLDMYKILSGHAEMYTGYGTENEVLIGILKPGDCFGEFGLLTEKSAIYTIIAYSEVKLYRVTEALINDFMAEYPDSIIQIMKNMARSMLTMQHQIQQLSHEMTDIKNEIGDENEPQKNTKNEMLRAYAIRNNDKITSERRGMKFLDRKKE